MILDQKIKVKWNSRNKKYYESKGYICTKMGEEFEINVLDLMSYFTKVKVICDNCKIEYLTNFKGSVEYYCRKCSFIKTNLERYGVENPSQNKETKEKIKQTCILKYGVSNPNQCNKIKDKTKKTNLKKYGVENISQSEEIKKKKIENCLKNHGVDHYSKTEEYKEKYKQTCINKYNVEYPLQNKEINDKMKQTMNDRYGSENAGKVKKIQEKTKQTILERYGVEHISQINVNKRIIKGNQTLYERGNGSCSKEQQYICNLYKIKPNYPVDKLKLDIAFPNEMLYIEYDGGGHNKQVKCGWKTEQEFNKCEIKRKTYLQSQGWSKIRIISTKDWLPSDEVILDLIQECKDYLNTGHSWIEVDIDNSEIRSSKLNKIIELGELRKIEKER